MTSLDLSPHPCAAPAWKRVLTHAWTEFGLIMRNGEQVLLALVIPITLLITGHYFSAKLETSVAVIAPSVLALAVWSTTFTSVAIATGFERRWGVLERLAGTPLGKTGLLLGKAICVAGICLVQISVLAPIAFWLGWRPTAGLVATIGCLIVIIVAGFAFTNLALILAGTLRAESVLALANTIYVLLAAAGALVLPLSAYPRFAQPVLMFIPTTALGEMLRAWSAGIMLWWPFPVVLLWAIGLALIARKVLTWMS